jgi:hypothetical protein
MGGYQMKRFFISGLIMQAVLAAILGFTSCGVSSDNTDMLMNLIVQRSVHLFQVVASHDGNFDVNGDTNARTELDMLAVAKYLATYSYLNCSSIHAFISVSAGDEISNLGIPDDRPVRGPNGVKIADTITDFFAGNLLQSMQGAGVTGGFYWTGSTSDGGVAADTCTGWTVKNSATNGAIGDPIALDQHVLSNGTTTCDGTRILIGVCW